MMDFDKYITRVQTSIKRIEKSVGVKFVDITRDCLEEVEPAFQMFSDFLKELKPSPKDLRHINLYLLINTDFESVHQLQDDNNFCHLVNTIPKLSTLVYFEFMNHTDMYKYIDEIILFTPEVFAVEVLKCISFNLNFTRPEICNHLVYLLFEGLYKKVLILQQQPDCENIRQKFIKIFQAISEFSIFEVIEKTQWEKEKRQCYFGRYVKSLLELIENCTKLFNNPKPDEKLDLYKMDVCYDYNLWTLQTKEDNWPVYCLNTIISKAKRILMEEVNVDVYISWCEEDYEEGKPTSLQTAVREAAYSCREAVETLSNYEHKLVSLRLLIKNLNMIAIKPKSEEDEFAEADTETIAKNMKNPKKTQLKWLKTYLDLNNILLENRCADDLKTVSHIFTKASLLHFIEVLLRHMTKNEIPRKKIELYLEIIFQCVRKLRVEEQIDILNTVAPQGSDTLKSQNFNSSVTETFNKLVNQSDRMEKLLQDIIILALESGRELVGLMLVECTKAVTLCDLFIQIFLEIPTLIKYTTSSTDSSPLCFKHTLQHFDKCLRSDNKEERYPLIYMIKKLSWYNIIDGKEFVVNHLIPVIQKCALEKDWKKVDVCLDVLEPFVDGNAGEHVRLCEAEVVAFLAQVLNRSRLQPHQFTVESGYVTQKAVSLLYVLTANFLSKKNDKSGKEASWLREVGKSLSPLAWFPMRKLWHGMDLPPDPNNQLAWSKQSLGREDLLVISEQDRASFVVQLCKVLPLLSVSEWKMIGFDLGGSERAPYCIAIFHILADCLLVLNQLPVVSSNPTCMAYLISGFTSFFKVKCLNALKHSDRDTCLTVMNKQVILINEFSSDVLKMRLAAVSSVLQDMSGLIIDKAAKDQHQADLLAVVSSLKDVQIQSMLSNRLLKSLAV